MRVVVLTLSIVPVAYIFRDLEMVVMTRFIVTVAVAPTLFFALSRALDVPMRDFAIALWRPIVAGLSMTVVVLAVNGAIDFTGTFRLILDIAIGATTFAVALMTVWFVVGRPDGPERTVWERLTLFRSKWAASFRTS
jgi:hypothetical protein